MEHYLENLQEEKEYLKKTMAVIGRELDTERSNLENRKSKLIAAGKDMWENSAHHSNDFEKMTEVSQHLAEVASQTGTYENTRKRIEKLERMQSTPYFGRFDFKEEDTDESEKIYIGIHNLTDSKTLNIMVYDWRAPISSIFYRFEPGKAAYKAPFGEISGEVLLKRQYKIQKAELKYYFDCSIQINDEILQEVLSRNSSVKMRNIVETIQKEQDLIIRDIDNDLLVVQGVAGSGKTSIAMHRIAFLLYQGLESKLGANNILIISPNATFSKYISSVLPELGEDNVEQRTVEELFNHCFEGKLETETRNAQLDTLITCEENGKRKNICESMEFKGSKVLITMLDRLLRHFEHQLLEFEDIYYDGRVIENRNQLKSTFLNNKIDMPMAKRLKRMESNILDRLRPLQKERLEKIEKIVQKSDGHEFEIKQFSRLLSIKETKAFLERLHRFTEIDCIKLYLRLFEDADLFQRISKGLELPENIGWIVSETIKHLKAGCIRYEDAIPLLYLKLKIEGSDILTDIKQVVVDEAQDYYPVHYAVFKLLFQNAKFTILGDVCQTVEKDSETPFYETVAGILGKKKTVKLFLNKSYRASYEINQFSQKLLKADQNLIPFERHESEPQIIEENSEERLEQAVIKEISYCLDQGWESVAVICKSYKQAEETYLRLKKTMKVELLSGQNDEIGKGVAVIPVYMAKGLEFDAVIVYGADAVNYSTEFDRRLLYIACTRALHRLSLCCIGERSPLIR